MPKKSALYEFCDYHDRKVAKGKVSPIDSEEWIGMRMFYHWLKKNYKLQKRTKGYK